MGEERKVYKVGKPKGKRPLENQGIDGNMGSKWILERLAGRVWSGFNWLRIGTSGGF
jgi:hypothetical protein